MKKHLISAIILLGIFTLAAYAVPQQINYQGSLTDLDGAPLDTTVAIIFNIWPVPTGGSADWTESHAAVVVTNGLFHVLLGSVTALPDSFAVNRWLGISIGGDTEMIPREHIVSVAHAYRVGTVDGATGGTITSDVIINNKLNVGTGNTNAGSFANVHGQNNIASANHATVGGGRHNRARGDYSVIAGGGGATEADSNSATGTASTIGGGLNNTVAGTYSTVAGGYDNDVTIFYSTISGGINNTVSGDRATIGGGELNTASGAATTVSGGGGNNATGGVATVSGGAVNTASGGWSTISGGNNNTASANFATVPGGSLNTAAGLNSFAAGFRARANHTKSFVWGGSSSSTDSTASFSTYTFTARCANGARFYTAQTGTATGVSLPAGGGAWASLSDSTTKRRYGRVNGAEMLDKISRLPIERWSYKTQDAGVQHIGPMAQDFYAAFGLGESDTTISTLDPDGIALAAIQELAKENSKLQTSNLKLEERIMSLEAIVMKLTATSNQTIKQATYTPKGN